MKYLIAFFVVVMLTSCASNDEDHMDMNHPITDTMGCQPDEVLEDGTCVPLESNNNAEIFGPVDLESLQIRDIELGYLVRPNDDESYPGVIMIHEWWGLNQNIKDMAHHLATEGYVVLAVDLYDGKVAETSEEARELTTAVRNNPQVAVRTMKQAATYLRNEQDVSKLASMGWCFGGGQSLNLATSGEELDATIIYYGTLTDDQEKLSQINWPVLGIFGSEDTSIPVESVNSFETALNNLAITNEITIYEGVGHAFANPSGSRFSPDETKDAWDKTVSFLDESLKSDRLN